MLFVNLDIRVISVSTVYAMCEYTVKSLLIVEF
jgi:hypothetical protein